MAHLAAYGVAHQDHILLWFAVRLDEMGDLIPPEVWVVGCFPGLGTGPKPQEVDCQHCRAVERFLSCAQEAAMTAYELAHPCAVRSSLPPASGSEGCCPQICKQQPGYRKGCCFPGSQNAAMRIRVLLSSLRTQTLTSRQGKLKKQVLWQGHSVCQLGLVRKLRHSPMHQHHRL